MPPASLQDTRYRESEPPTSLSLITSSPLQEGGRKDFPPLLFMRGGTERVTITPLCRCSLPHISRREGGDPPSPSLQGMRYRVSNLPTSLSQLTSSPLQDRVRWDSQPRLFSRGDAEERLSTPFSSREVVQGGERHATCFSSGDEVQRERPSHLSLADHLLSSPGGTEEGLSSPSLHEEAQRE